MRHALKIAALATLMALGVGGGSAPAAAQGFSVRVGPDRPYVERRVIERRVRPARRTVCRREIREHVRPNGVIVRRPVEVCRTRTF